MKEQLRKELGLFFEKAFFVRAVSRLGHSRFIFII